MSAQLGQVPPAALAVLVILSIAELALDVVALVHLYRTPKAQVVGGNKWIWVAIILLINLVGAVLYLGIGHRPAPAQDTTARGTQQPVGEIVDSLYTPRDQQPPP